MNDDGNSNEANTAKQEIDRSDPRPTYGTLNICSDPSHIMRKP